MTGRWLRGKLAEKGWTQEAFARELGITRGGVRGWLRREHELIPPARQRQVIEVLGRRTPPKPPAPRRRPSAMPDLREQRLAVGLTQGELAQRTGIPLPSLANYERGVHAISADRAAAIEDALAEGPVIRTGSEGGSRRDVATLSNTPRGAGRKPQTYESMKQRTATRVELDASVGLEPVTAEELRDLRAAAGLTRRQAAEVLGVTWSRVRNWEEATSPVPSGHWQPIRARLGELEETRRHREQAERVRRERALRAREQAGAELRTRRIRAGLTRRQVAAQLSISEDRVRSWERGDAAVPSGFEASIRSLFAEG